jgi:arylsulfatase
LPHVALHVPDAELKPYLDQGWNDSPFTAENGGYTPHFTPRAAYAAMISRMDSDIGALLTELKNLRLEENTIVIFSSDNGTTHLEQEVDYRFFNSVGKLRGLKGSLYEGGVRVPAIVRWPGHVAAGSSSDYISGFEDWMPTILEAAGAAAQTPHTADGVSLLPLITGHPQSERLFLYREFPGYGGQQSVRVGDWKAVRQNLNTGNTTVELYNIAEDMAEQHDVAEQHPDVVTRLVRLMSDQRVPSEQFPLRPFDAPAQRAKK